MITDFCAALAQSEGEGPSDEAPDEDAPIWYNSDMASAWQAGRQNGWGAALARWGRPAAPPAPEHAGGSINDEQREAVRAAVAEALGGAYDCTRVWEAWQVGTMGPDDFVLVAEDDDRVAEIADAAIEAMRPTALPAPEASNFDPRLVALATTSEQIPPGPYSEHELRTEWDAQANEYNQWGSLDSSEQLAWAQVRAIAADRNGRPTTPRAALVQPERGGRVSASSP